MNRFSRMTLAAIASLLFVSQACADAADALKRLQTIDPAHHWQLHGSLKIDIDVDGRPDYVFLSQDAKSATIGLVLGRPDHAVFVHTFGINDSEQESVCAAPAEIETESLDYDPYNSPGAIPGFKRSRTGETFILAGGECDEFHFFWNAGKNALDWWRL